MGAAAAKPQVGPYRQVAPRTWLVGADHVGSFLRDVSAGSVRLDQRVDLNPLDPRSTGFEGALPAAGRSISTSGIDRLLEQEGHFFRVIDEYASDTWGEGWRLESEDEAWLEQAGLIEDALNLRAVFEEADRQHLGHGLAGVYLSLEEANADAPEKEPGSVRKFSVDPGGLLRGVFNAQPIPRKAIVKAIIDDDPKSPRFGKPRAWVLKLKRGKGGEQNQEVHWSRFIEFRQQGKPGHEWDGVGLGKRIVDSALLLRNIEHSAAGAYYQRAAPLLIIEFAPGATPDQGTIDAIGDEVDELQRQDIQKLMALGFTVKALGEGSTLPDPKPFFGLGVEAYSIDSGVPGARLRGSSPGELASGSEDTRRWNARMSRRQNNWAGPRVVREFYARLDAWGVLRLPKKGFRVAWRDLGEPTAKERMDIEWKRGLAMYPYVASGIAPPAALVDYQAAEFELQKQRVVPTNVLFGQPVGGTPGGPAPGAGLERGQRRLDALSPSEKIMAPELRLVEQRFQHTLVEAFLLIGEALLARLEEATAAGAGGAGVAERLRAREAVARLRLIPVLAGDAAHDAKAIATRAQAILTALEQLDPDDPGVRLLLRFEAPSDDLTAALEEALRMSAEAGASGTFRELGRQQGFEGVLDETLIRIFKTVARSTGEAAAASLTAEIRRSVAEGLATGEGHAQLRDRVLAVFDRLARYEAERIARTESMRAYNQGARAALRSAGIDRWRFRTFDAACPICTPLDGQTFSVNDATAPAPPRHPNCRCLAAAAIEEAS